MDTEKSQNPELLKDELITRLERLEAQQERLINAVRDLGTTMTTTRIAIADLDKAVMLWAPRGTIAEKCSAVRIAAAHLDKAVEEWEDNGEDKK